MSSATPTLRVLSKSVYDTSIYINAIRNKIYYKTLLPHFTQTLPSTYFCAVVAQELRAGCRTPATTKRVESLLAPFRRTRRLVTPTFTDWEEAGNLLARMLQDNPHLREKLPQIINDTLIALSSLRIGAVVYTANKADFALVQQYRRFRFTVV